RGYPARLHHGGEAGECSLPQVQQKAAVARPQEIGGADRVRPVAVRGSGAEDVELHTASLADVVSLGTLPSSEQPTSGGLRMVRRRSRRGPIRMAWTGGRPGAAAAGTAALPLPGTAALSLPRTAALPLRRRVSTLFALGLDGLDGALLSVQNTLDGLRCTVGQQADQRR